MVWIPKRAFCWKAPSMKITFVKNLPKKDIFPQNFLIISNLIKGLQEKAKIVAGTINHNSNDERYCIT